MSNIVQVKDTRREFVNVLCELAEKDDRVCFIVPDVGFNYVNTFSDRFPKRYFNLGATEPSTIAEVAGMALEGMRPFVYSMINFVTLRVLEMIRNAVVMHNAPVILLGVKGSEKYKFLGFSHNMIFENEDVYHLNPYMDCYIAETPEGARNAVLEAYEKNECCYIRL